QATLEVHVEVADAPIDDEVVARGLDASLIDVLRLVLALRAVFARRERSAADVLALDQRAERIVRRELRPRVRAWSRADQPVVLRVEARPAHRTVPPDE